MKVELSILKYLLDYDNFNKYSSFINVKDFPDELRIVWSALCSIHSTTDASTGAVSPSPAVLDVANVVFASNPKDKGLDRKSTRLNSSHLKLSRMPSSA